MNTAQNHFRNRFHWLEIFLWIAGCAALAYCAFVVVGASITQARLSQSLEQARDAMAHKDATAAVHASESSGKGSGTTQTGLVGRLGIPRIGLSAMVLEGVGAQIMSVGIGHVPGTPRPGQPGNVALAGHRDTFFRPLRQIKIKDEISMDTGSQTFRYHVTSTEIVDPHDVDVLKSHHKNELTLITCYPFSYIGPAPKRFIVHADLVGQH
jgi:sortase A